jgi:mRNA-degrading endonuclease HigB of HigAB toxin-antitoxin module
MPSRNGLLRNFFLLITAHWLGALGAVLATLMFVLFGALVLSTVLGAVDNPYLGIVTFFVVPAGFALGLALIPLGLWRLKCRTGVTFRELFARDFLEEHRPEADPARALPVVFALTVVNVVFLGTALLAGMHYMETPRFCGEVCHSVMNPEWVAYQTSLHREVDCVACHVGNTTEGLIATKLNGAWQLISISFHLYEKPIPTPVHQLRPSKETCEQCHWFEKPYPRRLRTHVRFRDDEANTPYYNTLSFKIGAGAGTSEYGVHNHATRDTRTVYTSVDNARREILEVRRLQTDGTTVTYRHRTLEPPEDREKIKPREMDCTDCHNRVAHVFEDPSEALDLRMQWGLIDPTLPMIKRNALKVLTDRYPDKETALREIPLRLERAYYAAPIALEPRHRETVSQAASVIRDIYDRNIHPSMNIGWNTYRSYNSHEGCYRCHNNDMVNAEGQSLFLECTVCHSILALESAEPFAAISVPEGPEQLMYKYLRHEFYDSGY